MAACPAGHASHRSRSRTGPEAPDGYSRPRAGTAARPEADVTCNPQASLTSPADQGTGPLRPSQPERQAEILVGVLGHPLARIRTRRPIAELARQHLAGDELTVLGQRRG